MQNLIQPAANANPSRRLFLAAGPAVAVFASVKGAAAIGSSDAKIIELSAEIIRLNSIADEIQGKRVTPFEDRYQELLRARLPWKQASANAVAFSRECGRHAALNEQIALHEQADALFNRMMAIPAATQRGRAAKVRAVLVHAMADDWRGPDVDWDTKHARALLAEFAGMSAEEIAAI